MSGISIDPSAYHATAHGLKVLHRRGLTPWFDGRTKPARKGWYERLFIDGAFRQYWNGRYWSATKGGLRHWRQVGDYPCWRGLTCTALMSPSRYPVAR